MARKHEDLAPHELASQAADAAVDEERERAIITALEILNRVEEIKAMAGDPEMAHDAEDSLHVDVLQAIADGATDGPRECALAALTTQGISFPRWCA